MSGRVDRNRLDPRTRRLLSSPGGGRISLAAAMRCSGLFDPRRASSWS